MLACNALPKRITLIMPSCISHVGCLHPAYSSISLYPLCSRGSGTSTLHPAAALRWHSRYFSQFHALHLRRTYFPNKRPGGQPHRSEDFFSQVKTTINSLPSNIILWTVLGLNGVVYVLWNVGIYQARTKDNLTVLEGLQRNFTLSWKNWKEGRFWTLLTACFSNQATSHIFMNALTFYFMAPPVLQILGNFSFLTLYLGGGIASSVVTIFVNEMVLHQKRVVHGASGAIYAVISFMACIAPKAKFLVFGIVPVPAWGCVTGLFAYDLFNAIMEKQTGISEISHLAGILSGLAYFVRITGRFPTF